MHANLPIEDQSAPLIIRYLFYIYTLILQVILYVKKASHIFFLYVYAQSLHSLLYPAPWTWHSEEPIFHFYHCREHPCFVSNSGRTIITISLGDDVALASSTAVGIFVNRWLLMTASHPSARNRYPALPCSSLYSIKPSVPLTYVNSCLCSMQVIASRYSNCIDGNLHNVDYKEHEQ